MGKMEKMPGSGEEGSGRKSTLRMPVFVIPGYMEVVQIPKGSVHLEIKELALSKNYIGKSQICGARSVEHFLFGISAIFECF